ncbi:MAG TPA: glycosyltransferase, partial [Candidatus Obscuribacterales bacterium]
MKKCALLSFTPLRQDPRINRQVGWLRPHYDLVTLGPADAPIAGVPCLDCGLRSQPLGRLWRAGLLATRRFESFYWQSNHVQVAFAKLRAWKPDLIIANDIDTLPLAIRLREHFARHTHHTARVLFDAHEFYPEVYAADPLWKTFVQPYMRALCKRYMPRADARVTVSPGVASLYKQWLGLELEVVYNAPAYQA